MSLTLQTIGVACLLAGFFVFLFSSEQPEGRRMVRASIASGAALIGCMIFSISLTL